MLLSRSFTVIGLGLCLATACGSDEPDPDEEVNCAEETRDDEFVAGMSKAGDLWTFRLMDATPAPPDKGDNSWSVRVEQEEAGLEGLNLTVTPFMPDHGHGTPIDPQVTDEGGGDYRLAPVNMWMPGLWQVTVEAQDGDQLDSAVFAFCIQG